MPPDPRLDQRVGAVVVAYRPPRDMLRRTLTALTSGTRSPAAVVVVDNVGGDVDTAAVCAEFPAVTLHVADSNGGYAAGMNRGLARIGELGCGAVLLLSHETVLAPTCLELLEAALRDSTVAAVGPLLVRLSDHSQVWSAGGRITPVRRAARHVDGGAAWPRDGAEPVDVQWLDGACLLLRRAALDAVGGLRPDLFMYWEDVALCRSLRRRGYRVRCVRAAVAQQEPSMTPPYLDVRNRILVLGRAATLGIAADVVIRTAADVLRGRGLRRTRLRLKGLRDGWADRLDLTVAMERPP